MKRIIARLGKRVSSNNETSSTNDPNNNSAKAEVYYKFIESWFIKKNHDTHYEQFSKQFDMMTLDGGFCPPPPPMLRMAWSFGVDKTSGLIGSESETSLTEAIHGYANNNNRVRANQNGVHQKSINSGRLQKDNMDEFLSWAFFGVHVSTVQSTPSMQKSLDEFYATLQSEADLTFEPGRNDYTPRCFTFEQVNSLYRPYIVYAGVALMRVCANFILTLIGFRQYSCERGLKYWHRSAKSVSEETPFLFFHGIAPGGHAPYLPMIFLGLLRDSAWKRDIFLFENKPVSYSLCFDAVSEEDTVHGVLEALDQHLGSGPQKNLTFCGHSLGSCQLTMMVKSSQLRKRIRNLILIDPVSILLSEPDVMINFLYTRKESEEFDANTNSWIQSLIRFFHETKIHLVASSELFIEHYLRRNFAWYNSELWLADIPPDVNVLVCLSEHDEIVDSSKVERELIEHNDLLLDKNVQGSSLTSLGPVVEKIVWRGVGHAHCIAHPDKWADIHKAMGKMER